MENSKNLNDLQSRAKSLLTIYVFLCLNGDNSPKRDAALQTAKKAYDEVCVEISQYRKHQ